MSGTGKHRRPKSRSISRGFAAAGTGGAALALPLLGATGAHAAGAPAAAPAAAPVQAPQVVAAQVPAALQAAPAAAQAAPTVYTVVPGDYLSKIAERQHLTGGWEQLYADNREAVGTDPSLIHPGLKLTLGAKSAAPAAPAETPKQAKKSTSTDSSPSSASSGSSTSGDSSDSSGEAAAPAAPAPKAPAKRQAGSTSTGFVAPVGGGMSTAYKTAGSMWSSGYHTGVDFAASSGTTVKAVGAGTVVSAGWSGSYGNEVVIRHADGKYSQYAHLSQLSVSSGQSVTGGQTIGLSGSTGNSTGPHLHFEIRTGPSYGSDIDPLAYLRSKGVSI
ncbi:LysM peptidoglycan-binding domain-containing M23 family metallopeptidase [Streptomyces sp. G1]|uniref:LysM peptidoglycan-binding domain-containing M23 family metallopeptidase n=1 Tax=Streptomyces sp. G1 TaxID=361572 RepID=UPI00202E7091|nr:LysM peptidoglycan-binding domain-containing M23 family metallopeptidase [Streptomyces sp. G1]MCM1967325.1 LysM peptidoglycan-binding domain-containing M23 family metallopeptidase [Streptomyces sp. G1]